MTIDRISNGPLGPIDPSGGHGRTPAAIGEASARSVAVAVVGRIAAELSLTGGEGQALGADPYRLRELTDAVAQALPGANPAALGELERAIEGLAGAIAADMAGSVDGRTIERIDLAVAGYAPAREGVDGVTEFLDETARRVADAR